MYSIISRIRAIFIKISAKLNTGKSIGAKSMKSITYPCAHLSIPLPKAPASKKIIASIEIDHPIVLLVASRRKNVAARPK